MLKYVFFFLALLFGSIIAAEAQPEAEIRSVKNKTASNDILTRSSLLLQPAILWNPDAISLPPVQITANSRLLGAGTVVVNAPSPSLVKVGEIVQRIPTAISHQSQTIVHNQATVATPIVMPIVQTRLLQTIHTPFIYTSTFVAPNREIENQQNQVGNTTDDKSR